MQIQQVLPAEFKMEVEQIQRPSLAELDRASNALHTTAQPLLTQLSWMHYERLMRVKDVQAREWYMREAAQEQ